MDLTNDEKRKLNQQMAREADAKENERSRRHLQEFDQRHPGQHEEAKDAWLAKLEQQKKEQEEYHKEREIGGR